MRTLEELIEVCGPERPASVSREISKVYNTTERGTLAELHSLFAENNPRGEIVVVIGGNVSDAPKVHKNKYKDA